MLILVLGSHGQNSDDVKLPADIYELYAFAMDAAISRHFEPAERGLALRMLRTIAGELPALDPGTSGL